MTGTATITTGQFGRPTLSKNGRTITVRIPITLRHQGGRKQVVTPAGATPWIPTPPRVDSTLVKAIVRAHRWRDMLESSGYATIRDLAKAEAINESYLGRVLRLTLLSPEITAAEIERIVIDQLRSLLQTPEVIVQTWRAARKTDKALAESDVRAALLDFEPLWNELFPAEQARIVELLVERVDLQPDGIDLRLRVEGLTSLCSELRGGTGAHQEAA